MLQIELLLCRFPSGGPYDALTVTHSVVYSHWLWVRTMLFKQSEKYACLGGGAWVGTYKSLKPVPRCHYLDM